MAYDTLAQIKSIVLFRGDEPTDGTSDFDGEVDNILIEAWRDLTIRHPWLSLIKSQPGAFVTVAPDTAKTITIATAGASVAATLSAAPTVSIAGYRVQPTGKQYILRVTAHTASAVGCTIDAAPEALSAVACTIVKDEYDLASDVGMFVDGLWTPQSSEPVPLWSEERLKQEIGTTLATGWPPSGFARLSATKIRVAPAPSRVDRLEYPYARRPADPSAGTLEIDNHLRPIYVLGALTQLYADKFDRRFKATFDRYELGIRRAIEYDTRQRVAVLGRASGQPARPVWGE